MPGSSVVIVGAGIAGLSAAWELTGAAAGPDESTPRVEIIESSSRVGGALVTSTFDQHTIDLGADGFLARRPEAVALVRELGLDNQLEAIATSGASIFLAGALRELPSGLVLGVPTSAASLSSLKGIPWAAKWALRRDQFAPRRLQLGDDETIGVIVRRKLGDDIASLFVEPMIGGIQAGRIDELSATSVFPALVDAARKGGSLMKAMRSVGPVNPGPSAQRVASGPAFYTLLEGVGSIPRTLARRLQERGVVIRTGVPVSALRRTPASTYPWEVDTETTTTPANALIMAAPAANAARLLGRFSPALDALSSITCASAAMVTFAFARDAIALPESGTGVLVPLATPWSGEGSLMITAITFLDRKWQHLASDTNTLLRAHVGRIDDERASAMNDDELRARVEDELRFILGRCAAPLEARVQRWPSSLPQYRLGHESLVRDAKDAANTIRVALCGMTYDGVGVPASIGSGRRAANEVRSILA